MVLSFAAIKKVATAGVRERKKRKKKQKKPHQGSLCLAHGSGKSNTPSVSRGAQALPFCFLFSVFLDFSLQIHQNFSTLSSHSWIFQLSWKFATPQPCTEKKHIWHEMKQRSFTHRGHDAKWGFKLSVSKYWHKLVVTHSCSRPDLLKPSLCANSSSFFFFFLQMEIT